MTDVFQLFVTISCGYEDWIVPRLKTHTNFFKKVVVLVILLFDHFMPRIKEMECSM